MAIILTRAGANESAAKMIQGAMREYVAEIGSALPFLLCLLLKMFKFLNAPGYRQICRTLAAIAGLVGQREVVLGVKAVLGYGRRVGSLRSSCRVPASRLDDGGTPLVTR